MNNIDIKLWQKRAGILTESVGIEAEGTEKGLTENVRSQVREAIGRLLQEKKKKSKKAKPRKEEPTDITTPEVDIDMTAPEAEEGMDDMGMAAEPTQGGENDLMQKTLEFQNDIDGMTDDDKYKQIVQNLVSYLARKMNVEN